MNKQNRSEKGFTMVELIIVVAIMGIIGALLVPAFGTMSAKARITTDLSTVKTLKRTADSFKAEVGSYPSASNLASLNSALGAKGYLDASAVIKTSGASVSYDSGGGAIKLEVSNALADKDISKAISNLYNENKDYLDSGK